MDAGNIAWYQVAAVMGLLAVAFGAFGAHALKTRRSAEQLEAYKTGVLYHLAHAPVLLLLGSRQANQPGGNVSVSAWLFFFGILLFSGSLYALTLTGKRKLGIITPIGGLLLLAGWGSLLLTLNP
jgi:uncharacterized membrane protein YgdD (TMEM256/DUF423 family)